MAKPRWLAAEDLVSEDGLTVTKTTQRKLVCLSPDRPLPPNISRYYFEITFLDPAPPATTTTAVDDTSQDENGDKVGPNTNNNSSNRSNNDNNNTRKSQKRYPVVAIGFCTLVGAMIEFPGWEPRPDAPATRSWAYHGDDGGFFSSTLGPGAMWVKQGPRYGLVSDTVVCGVDFDMGKRQHGGSSNGGASASIWFTYNGERLGQHEFASVRGRLFPVLGLRDAVRLETLFGGDFLYQGTGGPEAKGVDHSTDARGWTAGEGDA